MSLEKIVAGDYGQALDITFIDVDTGAAADISGYTGTKSMIFTPPVGEEITKPANFKTDGTDGIIRYIVESGLLTTGNWQMRGRVASGSAVLSTEKHHFYVAN